MLSLLHSPVLDLVLNQLKGRADDREGLTHLFAGEG
jgi:hypothetical protein